MCHHHNSPNNSPASFLSVAVIVITLTICHVYAGELQSCPDRAALNKIDAWVHPDQKMSGRRFTAVNINELDDVKIIDVTKANVSVLCDGMVKMFNKLERLTLIDVNLSEILPDAFQNVPKLNFLSLAVNELTAVKEGQFRNLPALKSLYLSSNKIKEIDRGAFAELPLLERVILDRNEIAAIDGDWFKKNLNIRSIDLSFNAIRSLQAGAFTLPKSSYVDIKLQRNLIDRVAKNALVSNSVDEEEPFVNLHLDKNNLREIPLDFLSSMVNLHSEVVINSNFVECVSDEILDLLNARTVTVTLHLAHNPLSCECVKKFEDYAGTHDLKGVFFYESTLDCYFARFKPRW